MDTLAAFMVACLAFGTLCANAQEVVIVIENMPDNCQRENDGTITCDGYTVDEFCRLFGSSNESFCYGGSSGGSTTGSGSSGSGSGGGSGGGSNRSDSDDQDSEDAEDPAEATETATLEAFIEQCEGQGGEVWGGGQLAATFCEYPGDPAATCQCWNYAEYLAPEGPSQPLDPFQATYAACMGGAVALFDYVCAWH